MKFMIGRLFFNHPVYYAHLVSMRFQLSVCRVSLMYMYVCIYVVTSGHDWSMTHRRLKSHRMPEKQNERNVYVIIKAMCSPSYHHNDFMATHALEYMVYIMCPSELHCFNNSLSIFICKFGILISFLIKYQIKVNITDLS